MLVIENSGPALQPSERLGGLRLRVIGLCALVALLDGFDTQSIGFVAPVMAREWDVPVALFGPIFALGLLGGLFGAVGCGVGADRFGRRVILLITLATFAVGSLLTALATTMPQLAAIRFVTSVGLGGALPSVIALTSEYAPARLRRTLVTLMFCGFPLGAALGAVTSAQLIDRLGWQSVFIAGGIAPILLFPVIYFALPESIAWLAANGRDEAAARLIARTGPLAPVMAPSAKPKSEVRISPLELFRHGRALGSLLLGVLFFTSLLLVYLLVSWIPTIAVGAGYSVREGVIAAAVVNFTAILGSLLISYTSDRRGIGMIAAAYLGGAAGLAILAALVPPSQALFLYCAVAGFFCIGAQLCVTAIPSTYYPVGIRSTGIGWCMGIGRVGAIAGPLFGSLLVGGDGAGTLFAIIAGLSVGAGVLIASIRHMELRALHQVSARSLAVIDRPDS